MGKLSNFSSKGLVRSSGISSFQALSHTIVFAALLYGLSCILLCADSYCQTGNLGDAVQHPVPGAGHDYIHGLNETVNPANGSLNIKIDLPTLPSRGLTLPFAITYNSGEVFSALPLQYATGGGWISAGQLSSRSSAGYGWSDTLPYATASAITAYVYSAPPSSTAGYGAVGTCPVSMFYNFYDSAGVSHMLGLAAIGTETPLSGLQPQQGCNQATLSTTLSQPYYASQQSGGDDQVSGSMAYNCTGNNNSTITACEDGTPSFSVVDDNSNVYYFAGNSFYIPPTGGFSATEIMFPSTIEDRNGNIINFTTPTNSSAGLPAMDTAGRTAVSSNLADPINPTEYTAGGLTYNLSYTSANTNFTPSATLYPYDFSTSQVSCSFQTAQSGSIKAVQSISLPNGQSYTFQYDPTFGLVSKITYPNGGWVSYTWELSPQQSTLATFSGTINGQSGIPVAGLCNWRYQTPVISQRQVGFSSSSGAVLTQTFTYATNWETSPNYYWSSKTTTVTTTDNISGHKSETIYTYGSVGQPPQPNAPGLLQPQLPVETSVQSIDLGTTASPINATLQTVSKTWADQFDMTSATTIVPPGLSSEVVYCYQGDLVIERDEYGFGTSGPASPPTTCGSPTPTRKTTYAYFKTASPCQTIVYAGTTRVAETDAYLDGGSAPCSSGAGATVPASVPPPVNYYHDEAHYGPTVQIQRGNPTEIVRWLNTGGSVISTATYDETGQMMSTTDPCGNAACSDMTGANHTTTYSYTDSPTGGNAAGNSNAYVTQITDPLGNSQKFTYNYPTGELASSRDVNNQLTTYTYSDQLNRLTQTGYPDGGQTSICYSDSPVGNCYNTAVSQIITTKVLNNSGNPAPEKNIAVMDGMGHVTETELYTDPSGPDLVTMSYDGEGHVVKKYIPYRGTPGPFTTNYYDALGRPIETIESDGVSTLQWCYNGTPSIPSVANCVAKLGSAPSGNWLDSTDEKLNHWQRTSDAFGRMTEVMEPNGASQSPSMETDYSYDALNNLLSVTQWGGPVNSSNARSRSFIYDSLSRLTSATNPETNTIPYSYDSNSNLWTKTDGRGVKTIYSYDVMDHLLSKSYYSDGSYTPLSCYQYGSSAAGYNVERLLNEWTQSVSQGSCTASAPSSGFLTKHSLFYDSMGRLLGDQQVTPASLAAGKVYAPAYTYDLAGDLLTTTDGTTPSPTTNPTVPVTFTNTYDSAQHLVSVTSNWAEPSPPLIHPATLLAVPASTTSPTCANSIMAPYMPYGALANAQYGVGVTVSRAYDSRMRLTCENDVGSNAGATSGTATVTITGAEQTKQ